MRQDKFLGAFASAKMPIFLLLMLSLHCLGEVRVISQIGRGDIYVGSEFQYQIVVDGAKEGKIIDQTPLEKFSPKGPSVSDASQRSVMIINGKRTEKVNQRYTMTYTLIAPAKGTNTIGPIIIEVNGQQYSTNIITFIAKEPSKTEKMDLSIEVSKDRCYVGEPLTLTCKWYIETDLLRREMVKNWRFSIPAFSNSALIIEESIIDKKATSKIDVGSLETGISQKAVTHNGLNCVEVTFSKILIPIETGTISLGEGSVTCEIATGISNTDSFFGRSYEYGMFSEKADNITIDVNPLPQDNKPADFSGLIGEYDISAEASPTDVNVGDPITLKIIIEGEYLKPVPWPELGDYFAENFILPSEKSSPEIDGNKKIFTQTIRAKTDQITEIPSIKLSYFDAEKAQYVTDESRAIPLNISATKIVTLSDIEGLDDKPAGTAIKAFKGGISANYPATELLYNERFVAKEEFLAPPAVFIWSIPCLAVVASIIFRALKSKDEKYKQAKLKRFALRNASKKIRSLRGKDDGEKKQILADAICNYFSAKFNLQANSVTPLDCRELTLNETANNEIADRIAFILESVQRSNYSSISQSFEDNWSKETIEILKRIG